MSQPLVQVSPAITTLPVGWVHMVEYFSKGIDQQGPYYKCLFYIQNWSDSDTVVNAMLGISTLAGGTGSGGVVTKYAPMAHPLSPNLFCTYAKATGVGAPVLNAAGFPNYAGGCAIECEFRAPFSQGDFGLTTNDQIDPTNPLLFCTQEVELTSETYLIPASSLKLAGNAMPGNQPFRLRVPIAHLNLTFHKLPYIPMGTARALRGHVNSSTFLGAAAGCVLFKSARIKRDFSADGSIVQEVLMSFAERDSSQKWNQLPDATLTWQNVTDSTGANTPYPTADLSPLVQF